MSADNDHRHYGPVGFDHEFLTLKPGSEIVENCNEYYSPKTKRSIKWDNPTIGNKWPFLNRTIINGRDAIALFLSKSGNPFSFGENS